MTVAELGYRIDSSQAVTAKANLDRMTTSATQAEAAQQKLASAASGSNAALLRIAAGVDVANALLAKLVAATDASTAASAKYVAGAKQVQTANISAGRSAEVVVAAQRQTAAATDQATAALNRQNAAVVTGLAAAARARAAAGVDVWGRTPGEVAASKSLGGRNSNAPGAAIPVAAPAAARVAEASAVTGAASAGVGAIGAFRSALISLLSPATAIQFLLFSVGGAVVQYFTTAEDASKKFKDSLDAHVKSVQDLGKAYRDASIDMGEVQRKSVIAAEALERLRRAELNRELKTQTEALTSGMSSFNLGTYLPDWLRSSKVTPVFAPFTKATEELRDGLKRGKPDFDAFEKQIQAISDTDPGKLRQWGDILIDMAAKVAQARRELGMLDEVNRNGRGDRVVGPAAMDDRAAAARRLMEEQRAAREQQQRIQEQQTDAEMQMMRARTNAQRLAAIEAKVRAEPASQNDPGVDIRVQRALSIERTRQAVEERNANDDRHRSQLRSIEAAREDLSLIGATAGETEKLNYQYAEIARLKDEAYKRGGLVSPEEVARIKETAVELGKIADMQTRLNLDNDLTFERSQQFLSKDEQTIASRLRGTGIGMDSPEAQQMRDMTRFGEAKDLASGFLSGFKSELLNSGGNIGKALGASILNALTNSMDKAWSKIFDQLATAFASALTGQKSGGGGLASAGTSVVGSILGGANDNYAPGAVTRAPLAAVGSGGVAAQAWNFFKSKGLADHQVAGILGNISAESAFKPTAIGDAGNAFGLFQHNDRGPQLLSAIGGKGNLGDVQGQLDFAWKELNSSESGALARLKAAPDVRSATAAFAGFERPRGFSLANPEGADNFSGRLSGAEQALDKFGGTAAKATGSLGSLGEGMGKMGSVLSQFPAAPSVGGGGGGLLGSLFGGLSSAFSGTKAFSFLSANPGGYVGLYADGTENAPEGWAWVGERGPELKKLRSGDVIRSNPASMQMVANQNRSQSQGKVELHVHVSGASGDDHVRTLAKQGAQEAIGEYHQGQVNGGFGETQRRYASQKG